MVETKYTPLEGIEMARPSQRQSDEVDEEIAQPLAWQQRSTVWPKPDKQTWFLCGLWLSSLISVWALARMNWDSASAPRPPPSNVEISNKTYPRVAKISMLYGGFAEPYQRALDSHQRHADHWGYPFYVSREDGNCGFWNKLVYIISILAKEFTKPEAERVEWIMWVDADTIILNGNVPAEVFLPPKGPEYDHIHFVGNRDFNDFNAGVFFQRVSDWSVQMLMEAMAFQPCNPDYRLGRNKEQIAMELTFNKTVGGPHGEGYKYGVVYMPQIWFNTYERNPHRWNEVYNTTLHDFEGSHMAHLYQGQPGDLLVHFPGISGKLRENLVSDWEELIEGENVATWAVPLEETSYPERTRLFWERYKTAMDVLNDAHDSERENVVEAARKLRLALAEEADIEKVINDHIERLRNLVQDGGES